MVSYIIRRVLLLPVTLLGMTVIIFTVLWFLGPETRASYYISGIPKNDAILEGIIKRYGLRDPIPIQYWNWMVGRYDPEVGETYGGILRGDLGFARFSGVPVAEVLRRRFPATLELTLFAFLPILGVGVWLGVLAAVHHNSWIDYSVRLFSIAGYSFPGFVFGLLALLWLYAELGWFPPGRVSLWVHLEILNGTFATPTGLFLVDAVYNSRLDVWWDAFQHLFLPALTLSGISWALFLRITRSSMLETLRADFITTARSKGLQEQRIIYRHALANALIPVVTCCGMLVAGLLGGTTIIETIFDFPGLGSAAAEAAARFDVYTVLSCTLLTGCVLILANLAVDILYAVLDPRIRLS